MGELTKENLNTIMQELAKNGRIFQNEAQFQFELAWAIKGKYKNLNVYLEPLSFTRFENVDGRRKVYSDIIIADNSNKFITIELKYKTRKSNYGNVELLTHGATDLGRFDFLYDIYRIEELKKRDMQKAKFNSEFCEFCGGFAILLTNEEKYWKISKENNDNLDKNFCISNNDFVEKGKQLSWNKSPKKDKCCIDGTFRDNINLQFNDNYYFKWETYYNDDKNYPFKYLIIEIKP